MEDLREMQVKEGLFPSKEDLQPKLEKVYKYINEKISELNKQDNEYVIEIDETKFKDFLYDFFYAITLSTVLNEDIVSTAFTFHTLIEYILGVLPDEFYEKYESFTRKTYEESINMFLKKLRDSGIIDKIIDSVIDNIENVWDIILYEFIVNTPEKSNILNLIMKKLDLERRAKDKKFDLFLNNDEMHKKVLIFTFDVVNYNINKQIEFYKEFVKNDEELDKTTLYYIEEVRKDIKRNMLKDKLTIIDLIYKAYKEYPDFKVNVNDIKSVDELFEMIKTEKNQMIENKDEIIPTNDETDKLIETMNNLGDIDIENMNFDNLMGLEDNELSSKMYKIIENSMKSLTDLSEYIIDIVKNNKKLSTIHKNKIDALCKNIDFIKNPKAVSNEIWSSLVKYDKKEITLKELEENIDRIIYESFDFTNLFGENIAELFNNIDLEQTDAEQ